MSVEPGSFRDLAQAGALLAGLSFVFVWGISNVLERFVALKSPPDKRAFWTVSPAILVAIACLEPMVIGLEVPLYFSGLILLPGLLVFLMHRQDYRKSWIPDEEVTEDVSLQNDDWRIGLAAVLIVALAAGFRLLWRYFISL